MVCVEVSLNLTFCVHYNIPARLITQRYDSEADSTDGETHTRSHLIHPVLIRESKYTEDTHWLDGRTPGPQLFLIYRLI